MDGDIMRTIKRFWMFIAGVLCISCIISKIQLPEIILMKNENVHNEGIVYEKVWEAYDKLPDNVKEMLDDESYSIYVVDPLESIVEGYITLGKTFFRFGVIQISNTDIWVERTTLHEIGHVIDDESAFTFISRSNKFKEIYQEEKDAFRYVVVDNYEYCVSSELEYFAQAFSEYIINPEGLKMFTPRTYEFIDRCVKNI
jgi:diphthamide synthase subunit DPH2